MPQTINPYFYRGSNDIELDKFHEAIADLEHVASDTTNNTHVLMVRSEAFKWLKQYDTAISICNRLLDLNVDSLAILSQRGICFYLNGQKDKACLDFKYCKKLGADTSFLNKFLKDCN
jgi:tetratricopeptide (TPR) repeat protein